MPVIDIHTHFFPPSAQAVIGAGGGHWLGSELGVTAEGSPVLHVSGRRRVIGAPGHLQAPSARLAHLDRLGEDIQVLSLLPTLLGYDLSPGRARDRARATNEELAGYVLEHPTRFLALATVPAMDADAAVSELERAMRLPGFVGVELGSHVGGLTWDEPALFPILAAAEHLDALVLLHPIDVRGRELFARYYLHNGVGNPVETTLAVASLVFGGVLDRLPDLRICLAHGGGYIALAAGRLDHLRKVRAEVAGTSHAIPSDYLRRFLVDDLTHSRLATRFLVDVMGMDRVVLGSDFPSDMSPADPVGDLVRNDLLTSSEKTAILGGNLVRELRLIST